jgi:hypothetical protein
LNNFLNFIFLGKGITIGTDIGRKVSEDKRNEMIMNTMGRRESLGSGRNNLMFGEDGLEVMRHRGCFNGFNGMDLCNNSRMTFFKQRLHAMGTYDLQEMTMMPWNLYWCHSWWNCMVNSLKPMRMGPKVLIHFALNTISQSPMSIENI